MQEALRFLSPDAVPVDRTDFVEQARLVRRGSLVPRGLPLTIRGLRKSFGDNEVLRGIDLQIPAGQFVAIVGRSGCGKSTLLRLMAGLSEPTAGEINIDDGEARNEPIRLMFQDPRLLPWQSVSTNVEVGLTPAIGKARRRREARELLARVGLVG